MKVFFLGKLLNPLWLHAHFHFYTLPTPFPSSFQSINKSTNQPINQSISQSINESFAICCGPPSPPLLSLPYTEGSYIHFSFLTRQNTVYLQISYESMSFKFFRQKSQYDSGALLGTTLLFIIK